MIGICAIARNEGEYVEEWMEHHKSIGVDQFFIYNNNSVEDYFPRDIRLSVMNWPFDFPGRQLQAYYHCARTNQHLQWIAFIDLDEYITLRRHKSLVDFLKGFPKVDAVALNWICYGANGFETRPPSFHDYTRHGSLDLKINTHVKSIVRPTSVKWPPPDAHFFNVKTCNEVGAPVTSAFSPHSSQAAYIKHIFTRSRAEYAKRVARGSVNNDAVFRMEDFDKLQKEHNALPTPLL